jgi:hypothetical protein
MRTRRNMEEQKNTSIAINRANEKRKIKRTKFEWVSKLYIVQHATFSAVSKIMTFPYTHKDSLSLSPSPRIIWFRSLVNNRRRTICIRIRQRRSRRWSRKTASSRRTGPQPTRRQWRRRTIAILQGRLGRPRRRIAQPIVPTRRTTHPGNRPSRLKLLI